MTESDTKRPGLKESLPGSGKISPVDVKPEASQYARFIESARQQGADEDEAAFKVKLATIAKQKPKDEPKLKKGGR